MRPSPSTSSGERPTRQKQNPEQAITLSTWRCEGRQLGVRSSTDLLPNSPQLNGPGVNQTESDDAGSPITCYENAPTGTGRHGANETKHLVGFTAPWRFESSLRHKTPCSEAPTVVAPYRETSSSGSWSQRGHGLGAATFWSTTSGWTTRTVEFTDRIWRERELWEYSYHQWLMQIRGLELRSECRRPVPVSSPDSIIHPHANA